MGVWRPDSSSAGEVLNLVPMAGTILHKSVRVSREVVEVVFESYEHVRLVRDGFAESAAGLPYICQSVQ